MFEETLRRHLKAIETKDLLLLNASLPSTGDLFLAFPNGKFSRTVEAYREFYQTWFSALNWVVAHEVISQVVEPTFAVVNLMAHNRDQTPTGGDVAYNQVVTLVFHCKEERWQLISEQSTIFTAAV